MFEDSLAEALRYDAEDIQIAALEEAAASGDMTWVEFEPLLEATFSCFDAAGISYELRAPRESYPGSGFLLPDYIVYEQTGLSDHQSTQLISTCLYGYSEFASQAYQLQPLALEAAEMAFAPKRESVIACMREAGAEVDDDANYDEIRGIALDVYIATAESGDPVKCMDF